MGCPTCSSIGWPATPGAAIFPLDWKENVIAHPGTAAPRGRADQLLKASVAAAFLWLLSITLSIAVAEAALWLSALAWSTAWLIRELDTRTLEAGTRGRGPAGDVLGLVGAPIIVFFTLSLVSAISSPDQVESLLALKEVFLFAAPLVTWAVFRDPRRRDLGREVFALGILAAVAVGIYQTATGIPAPGESMFRASGTLGHYMTFSGVLLVGVPLLLSVRGGLKAVAARLVATLAVAMIGLTLTRSAWIGCAVALIVYFATGFIRSTGDVVPAAGRRRTAVYVVSVSIAVVIVVMILAALAGPDALYERAASTFSLDDPSNHDRIAMAATGLKIIKAYPYLGVGPGLMESRYPAWVVEWALRDTNPHLHNNLLQIAAERGLLGLSAWLWMMAAFFLVAWRVLRAQGATGIGGPESRAALAALAGFVTMGMFEYNFSDSEVLMALLFVVSLPLAASAGLGGSEREGAR